MYDFQPETHVALSEFNQGVGLVNTYSTRNLGDAAIMAALAGLVPAGCVKARIDEDAPCAVPGLALVESLKDCRSFISVGGDIFNNARPRLVTRNFLGNVSRLFQVRERAMVFGQTIPSSCQGLALTLLAQTLRRTASVTVRDRESHRLLTRLGVEARLSFDAAFTLQPYRRDIVAGRRLFDRAGFEPDRTALISVRGFDGLYRHDPEASLRKLVDLARLLEKRGHRVGVLIQSDVGAADSDRPVARQILKHVPNARAFDLFEGGPDHTPVRLLQGVLHLANIVIGVRYHASVLRLASGRQPYNLFYSRKGRDLGERLSLTGCGLEAFDPATEIDAIEATAQRDFDAAPVARDVASAFNAGFGMLA